MTVFVYDKTFEGLLTAVFDAYSRRSFPDLLLAEAEAAFRYGFVCDYRYLAI